MADSIKIGNLDISAFKVGGADCSIYLGDTKLYPSEEPPTPTDNWVLVEESGFANPRKIKVDYSLIEDDDVYFDQKEVVPTFGGLTVKYYISDPTSEVTLFNGGGGSSSSSESSSESGGGGALPTRMIVDGVEETPINTWRFETAGEHIVQYEFTDNIVPQGFLINNPIYTEVIVGDDITEIGAEAFLEASNEGILTSATIGTSIQSIGTQTFVGNVNMTSITIKATTPPTLGSTNVFNNTNNCPIYVPASAVEEYQTSTSTGWSTYESRIEAIQ